MKKNTKIFFMLADFFIFSAVIVFIFLFIQFDWKSYSLVLLPLFYVIFTYMYVYIVKKQKLLNNGIIFYFAFSVIYIRYVLGPLSIAFNKEVLTQQVLENLLFAVILMIIELLGVYIVFYFNQKINYKRNKYKNNFEKESIKPIKNSIVLIIFILIAIGIILVVDYNMLIPSQIFIIDDNYEKKQLEIDNAGIIYILVKCVVPCLFICIFSFTLYKYRKTTNYVYILLSVIVVLMFMALKTSTSRWEMLFAMLIGIYFLKNSYPKIPKIIITIIIIITVISIISISLYKFFWIVKDVENPVFTIIKEMFFMIGSYFSGPVEISKGISMIGLYNGNISIYTFFNDFLGSVPWISNFIDQTDRINVYYNLYNGITNNSLIVPLVVIGFAYCPIFPIIFTLLAEILVMIFDKKEKLSSTVEYKYIYIYTGLYMAMCLGFNTQILFSVLLNPFMLLIILFKINEKITIRKK